MADVSVIGNPFMIVQAVGTVRSLEIEPERQYSIINNGRTSGGISSTEVVFFALSENDLPDGSGKYAEGMRLFLPTGRAVLIGPNWGTTLYFRTSGNEVTFQIVAGRKAAGGDYAP